jgi:alpha-tubulin suppressor-like RCC1 family protein
MMSAVPLVRKLLTAGLMLGALAFPPTGVTRAAASPPAGYLIFAWGEDGPAVGNPAAASPGPVRYPVRVLLPPSVRVTSLSAAGNSALALTTTGAVYAWGANDYGQLGDGTTTTRDTPVKVAFPAGTVVTAIATNGGDSFAVTSTGAVYGWGYSGTIIGQSTAASNLLTPTLITDAPPAAAVAVSNYASFILSTSGQVYALGGNFQGSLGTGAEPSQTSTPIQLTFPGNPTIAKIGVGDANGYAITSTGQLDAWGPSQGIGDGNSNANDGTPIATSMPAGTVVTQVSGGQDHTVALTADGTAYAWGQNNWGQLGTASPYDSSTPVPVDMPAGVKLTDISAAYPYTLAVSSTGTVYSWGNGNQDELGTGSEANRHAPGPITLPQQTPAHEVTANAIGPSFALVTPEPPPDITPTINGTPRVADTLACAPATPPPTNNTATWKWSINGRAVATTQTYTVPVSAYHQRVTCALHLNDGDGTKTTASRAITPIWHTSLTNTKAPVLSGPHKVGGTETLRRGTWTPRPTSWRYQWYSGPSPIKGATTQRLRITTKLRNMTIHCTVRVTRHHDNPATTTTNAIKIAK